jgi:HK97 family phage prohead protease
MNKENRHIKEVIDAEETITIVYGKSEEWEGIKYDESSQPMQENNLESDEQNKADEKIKKELKDGHLDSEMEDEEDERMGHEEDEDEDKRMGHEEDEDDDERMNHDEDEDDKKRNNNIDNLEKRFFNIETRVASEGNKKVVRGHAAVFGELSEDLGGFREMINPDAFNDVLDNDVRAFFNHDPNFLLARTTAGTLRLGVDEKGLSYEFDVPDTSAGRDLLVSMERGDITQSSFAFTISQDSWSTTSEGEIRTIEKVARLFDVSPVSIPAYPSANDLTIAQRSKEIYNNKTKKDNTIKRHLGVLGLQINLLKKK